MRAVIGHGDRRRAIEVIAGVIRLAVNRGYDLASRMAPTGTCDGK